MFTTSPYILIFGQDLVYWTGMLAGLLFLMVILSAVIKQFNIRGWIKYQIPMTRYHHLFGWLSVAFLVIHTLLAILAFNFKILF